MFLLLESAAKLLKMVKRQNYIRVAVCCKENLYRCKNKTKLTSTVADNIK